MISDNFVTVQMIAKKFLETFGADFLHFRSWTNTISYTGQDKEYARHTQHKHVLLF